MIYKLRFDFRNYLNFYIDAVDIEMTLGDFFLLDEPLWSEFWQPLNGTFFNDSDNQTLTALPDITEWFGHNCLVLNQKAFNVLSQHLAAHGEFLPIQSESIPYWLFHSTIKTGMEKIDESRSTRTIDESGFVEMHELSFREETLKGQLIFQTEFSNYRNMYCTEEFKVMVESNGLKGLSFSTDLACINEI